MCDDIVLKPGNTPLSDLRQVFFTDRPVRLERSARAGVERAVEIVSDAAKAKAPIYGVNTGFGKLAGRN